MTIKQGRLGPLTLDTRRWLLAEVLSIQDEVNQEANTQQRPTISWINKVELARIEELIAANTYPEKWDGTELTGDVMLPEIFPDGSVQPLLFEGW